MAEKRDWVKLAKGIYRVGRKVYFRQMIAGQRITRLAELQGAEALDDHGRATRALKREYNNWVIGNEMEEVQEQHAKKAGRIPTCEELIEMYIAEAQAEQVKNGGTPSDRTIKTVSQNFRRLVEESEQNINKPYTVVTTRMLENYFVTKIKEGLERVSAWTYISSAQSITASWALKRYEELGYRVESIALPSIKNRRSDRYERPSEETRRAVREWYAGLWEKDDKRLWLAATMMLQFAMRNGDVIALTWENLTRRENKWFLNYMPRKTSHSSARKVIWPIHPDVWEQMQAALRTIEDEYGQTGALIPACDHVLRTLNYDLRSCVKGFAKTTKALYELRKLRVDAEYRRFGAERASALSGDDIRTLSYFYADIADLAPVAVRAEDLI